MWRGRQSVAGESKFKLVQLHRTVLLGPVLRTCSLSRRYNQEFAFPVRSGVASMGVAISEAQKARASLVFEKQSICGPYILTIYYTIQSSKQRKQILIKKTRPNNKQFYRFTKNYSKFSYAF